MKKFLSSLPAVLCSLFILAACTESFEDRCSREAREFTEKQCPRLVDQCVILDSMTYETSPQGFTYHYHVTGELDNPELLQGEAVENIIDKMRQSLRENISLKTYKEHGLTFTYRYISGSTLEPFVTASFGPEDYQ